MLEKWSLCVDCFQRTWIPYGRSKDIFKINCFLQHILRKYCLLIQKAFVTKTGRSIALDCRIG